MVEGGWKTINEDTDELERLLTAKTIQQLTTVQAKIYQKK